MMNAAQQETLNSYVRYYQGLTLESVGELKALVSADVRFRDPFNDVRGVELMVKVMSEMFADTIEPKFEILSVISDQSQAFLKWRFSFRPKRIKVAAPWTVEGVSELEFNQQGKIISHLDYWDAAQQFYERLPVIGFLLRLIRRRLAVKT